MTEEKKLTKEEKIKKAKELLQEVLSLELKDMEIEQIVGGVTKGQALKNEIAAREVIWQREILQILSVQKFT